MTGLRGGIAVVTGEPERTQGRYVVTHGVTVARVARARQQLLDDAFQDAERRQLERDVSRE